MDFSKVLLPEHFSGIWFCIHTLAADVKDDPYKWQFFEYFVKLIQMKMKCKKCKGHFGEYISKVPFIKYKKMKNGAYIWSSDFHNSVNTRLSKPHVSIDEGLKFYTSDELSEEQEKQCSSCTVKPINNEPERIYETPLNSVTNVYSALNNLDPSIVNKKTDPIIISKRKLK